MADEPRLSIDQCWLAVINRLGEPIAFWTQVDDCSEVATVAPGAQQLLRQPTSYASVIQVRRLGESGSLCERPYRDYRDQASYSLTVAANGTQTDCMLEQLTAGRNNCWPLLVLLGSLLAAVCLWRSTHLIVQARRRLRLLLGLAVAGGGDDRSDVFEVDKPELGTLPGQQRKRLATLDAFRGLVIIAMIFCNYGAGGYARLQHASWFGINFADLVFPGFLFIMGTSISLSLRAQIITSEVFDTGEIVYAILKRTLKLILLGLVVNSIGQGDLQQLRFPGVLQRLAVCYLLVSLAHLASLRKLRRESQPFFPNRFYNYQLADFHPFLNEWLLVSALVAVYSYFTLFYRYDARCPPGYQGPGGLHRNGSFANCTGGAARALDLAVFGASHVYQASTAKPIYQTDLGLPSHDPEGLLGTLSSVLLVFYGLQAGKILTLFYTTKERVCRWMLWTLGTLAVGLLTQLSGLFPVSKNLFSFSFVNQCAAGCFLLFAVLYLLIDSKKLWPDGWPLNLAGKNAIALFMGHELLAQVLPFYFEVDPSSHYLLLLRCSLATGIWLLIAVRLARSRLFFTV